MVLAWVAIVVLAVTSVYSAVASFHKPDGLKETRVDEVEHIVRKWKDAYGPDAIPGKPAR